MRSELLGPTVEVRPPDTGPPPVVGFAPQPASSTAFRELLRQRLGFACLLVALYYGIGLVLNATHNLTWKPICRSPR